MKTLTLIFTFCIIVAFSQAKPAIVPRPELNKTLKVNRTQQLQQNDQSSSCAYLLTIMTSCISPAYTTDQISLLFGDAHGHQAYIARLDDPASGTFQQCAIDVFDVIGPCLGKICHLYLYRSGSNGWVPERVIVDDYYYGPIAFEYNIDIPEGGGLGFNYCG
ncbi:embryo-specific protein ATS3B-like [Lotus japonicus]|uniref:Uncharacterized protein n=1 Tax=Lotus japonicus TaxID=34305 RepID=I3SN54_LOTJA|nr:embryo-specific protein ATS3B-like [Lotus japonicus]AFK41696.1 unknown [Lotus japonicus]